MNKEMARKFKNQSNPLGVISKTHLIKLINLMNFPKP